MLILLKESPGQGQGMPLWFYREIHLLPLHLTKRLPKLYHLCMEGLFVHLFHHRLGEEREAINVVLDILVSDSFYLEAHQLIFKAMLRLFEKSQPIDILTVSEELKKSGELEKIGGAYYLVELTNKVASSANL